MATINPDFINPPLDPNEPDPNDPNGGGLGLPTEVPPEVVAAAATDPTETTRRYTNDPSNPANYPPAGNNGPAPETTSPAGQQSPGGGPPFLPTNQERGVPPYGNIGFSPTISDLNTLNSFRNPDQKPNAMSYTTSPVGLPTQAPPPSAPTSTGTGGFVQPLLGGTPVGPQSGGAPGGDKYAQLGQYQNDPWARAFFDKNGYFGEFNTADSIRQELQRGGAYNWDKIQGLRGIDPRIDALVDGINRVGAANYFNSANAQQINTQHNAQITNDVNAGVYGKNQAAIANVTSQAVHPISNPIDQYHAELTNAMQQTLTDSLKALGATGVHSGFDAYGNATIDWFNRSNQAESIKATFVDLANAIETLRQKAAQEAAPAPPGGGGYNPRGGGGGYGPPGGGGNNFTQTRVPADAARAVGQGIANAVNNQPGITDYGNTNFAPNPGTLIDWQRPLTPGSPGAAPFGPFPPGSAGNPAQPNGSIPDQRYANSPPSAAPFPAEWLNPATNPASIDEQRRRGFGS